MAYSFVQSLSRLAISLRRKFMNPEREKREESELHTKSVVFMGQHRRTDQPDQEIADCNKAIELDPKNAITYNNRGTVYGNKGEFDQAIEDFTKAIELDPNYAAAYYNRGNAHGNKSDSDHAIGDYTKAIELDPKFPAAYFNRGMAERTKALNVQAIADFEAYLRLTPNPLNRTQVEQFLSELGQNREIKSSRPN